MNPYRIDVPGKGPFYGRANELRVLAASLRAGRNALAAVMGGRGMGKTSLALRLQADLSVDPSVFVRLIRRPNRSPIDFLSQIATSIGLPLSETMPTESLVEAIHALPQRNVVLLLDEIEALIASELGRRLLDNLRIAYEELAGKLGIVVFGGSALRELLSADVSPFLRTAQWLPLRGLSLDEAAKLIREPLHLTMSDSLVEVLWEETGGHPLLLQAILERAIDLGPPVEDRLVEATRRVAEEQFERSLFPIWWNNLQAPGQQVYRNLLKHGRPLQHADLLRVLGATPQPWVEVLETTGVARQSGSQLLPRCSLFQRWLDQNHPLDADAARPRDALPMLPFSDFGAHPFEELLVHAIACWVRATVEYPVWGLRSSPTTRGNARLLPEQHFQLSLLTALVQRELLVEPEPLSSARGRVDLKVRWPSEPTRRACIEVKIWDHTGYKDVVAQLLGYIIPDDAFGCVVMVDRQARPLRNAYRDHCLGGGELVEIVWPADETHAAPTYPAFVTRHDRPTGAPVRIYHFLVQLPPDEPFPGER